MIKQRFELTEEEIRLIALYRKRNGLQKLFKELMLRGYTSILVEGGKSIISSFIKKGYFETCS